MILDYQALYYELGELNSNTEQIWFVLHGYGQLAKYFIQKFKILDDGKNYIIAPEGLSRFYLDGYSGRVGATWMTKENREVDIKNYLVYLDTLYKTLIIDPEIKVNVIGFSQGAATVSRWATQSSVRIDKLILWAGIFPPDMEIKKASARLIKMKIISIYGEEDAFIKKDQKKEQLKIAESLGVAPIYITYNGGHDIDRRLLQELS